MHIKKKKELEFNPKLIGPPEMINFGEKEEPKKNKFLDKTGEKQEKKPVHHFKKGESGNPKGRPKGSISFTSIAKRELGNLMPGQRKIIAEGLIKKFITKAYNDNDFASIKLLWEYVDGKPKQNIGITGDVEIEIKEITEFMRELLKK